METTGQAEALHTEQAVGQRLVVVDHVELVAARAQVAVGASAERHGLGEEPQHRRAELVEVDRASDATPGALAGREGAVDVEAGQLGQPDALVEVRVGRSGQHRHLVSEVTQPSGEVAHVDALATRVGIATIGEECDAQRLAPIAATAVRSDSGAAGERRRRAAA